MPLRSRVIFFLGKLAPGVLGLAAIALLTRLLDPPEYGLYAFGLSLINFLTIGCFEWLGLSALRIVPSTSRRDLFLGTLLRCFYLICVLIAAAAAAALVLFRLESYALFTAACVLAAFGSAWFELKQRLQLAQLRAGDYFWAGAIRALLVTVLTCAVAYMNIGIPAILLALAAAVIVSAAFFRHAELHLFNRCFDWEMWRAIFRFGFPLSMSVGLATILISVDKWLLQALMGTEAVGLFTAASFVAQMPLYFLASGIGPSSYSLAVHAVDFHDPAVATSQLEQNAVILLGIILPAAAGIAALSANLAQLMVGASYSQSVIDLAPWLCAASVLWTVRGSYFESAFQLAHKTRPLIWITLITLAVNIGLDIWWIPSRGELGAAIGSFSASAVGLVIAATASRRVLRLPLPALDTIKIVVSTGIMFLVLHTLSNHSGFLALLGQIASGVLIYGSSVVVLNVFGTRDWIVMQLARRSSFVARLAGSGR